MLKIYSFVLIAVACFVSCDNKNSYQLTLAIAEDTVSESRINETINVLKSRLKLLHYDVSDIKATADRKSISIVTTKQLDKIDINQYLLIQGKLEFYECYSFEELAQMLEAFNNKLNNPRSALSKIPAFAAVVNKYGDSNLLTRLISFYEPGAEAKRGAIGGVRVADTSSLNVLFQILSNELPADCTVMYGTSNKSNNSNTEYVDLYFLKNNSSKMDASKYISEAISDKTKNEPVLKIKFNKVGTVRWSQLTRMNINKSLAIVFEGIVMTAPTVISEMTTGDAEINGNFTTEKAKTLAILISSGYLPVKLSVQSNEEITKH